MTKHRGFTLIELSIVVVIIGLIVAGVVAGQSLVHQSQLRSVTTEVNQYVQAVNSFRLQYNAFPGDIPNASDFWGSSCGGASLSPTGCNGNNNKRIESFSGLNQTQELWRAMQHMVLAGLINFETTGQESNGTDEVEIGVNAPASKLPNAGYIIEYYSWGYFPNRNMIMFGANRGAFNLDNPVVTPSEAYAIDQKLDDGYPRYGKVWSTDAYLGGWGNTDCMDGPYNVNTPDTSYSYSLSNNQVHCNMAFIDMF